MEPQIHSPRLNLSAQRMGFKFSLTQGRDMVFLDTKNIIDRYVFKLFLFIVFWIVFKLLYLLFLFCLNFLFIVFFIIHLFILYPSHILTPILPSQSLSRIWYLLPCPSFLLSILENCKFSIPIKHGVSICSKTKDSPRIKTGQCNPVSF